MKNVNLFIFIVFIFTIRPIQFFLFIIEYSTVPFKFFFIYLQFICTSLKENKVKIKTQRNCNVKYFITIKNPLTKGIYLNGANTRNRNEI